MTQEITEQLELLARDRKSLQMTLVRALVAVGQSDDSMKKVDLENLAMVAELLAKLEDLK